MSLKSIRKMLENFIRAQGLDAENILQQFDRDEYWESPAHGVVFGEKPHGRINVRNEGEDGGAPNEPGGETEDT